LFACSKIGQVWGTCCLLLVEESEKNQESREGTRRGKAALGKGREQEGEEKEEDKEAEEGDE